MNDGRYFSFISVFMPFIHFISVVMLGAIILDMSFDLATENHIRDLAEGGDGIIKNGGGGGEERHDDNSTGMASFGYLILFLSMLFTTLIRSLYYGYVYFGLDEMDMLRHRKLERWAILFAFFHISEMVTFFVAAITRELHIEWYLVFSIPMYRMSIYVLFFGIGLIGVPICVITASVHRELSVFVYHTEGEFIQGLVHHQN